MNMPYTSFAPMSFVIDRAMGMIVGVLIFFMMQRFVFGTRNSKLELLEESVETLGKLQKTLQAYKDTPTLTMAYQAAADIYTNTRALQSYVGTANLILDHNATPNCAWPRRVFMLNDRAVRLLIDEPTVIMSRVDQLLRVVTAKLAR